MRDPAWTIESLQAGDATALAEAPPAVSVHQTASEAETYADKRNRLAIRHASGDAVVAYIEIVSSGHKSSRRIIDRFLDKACSVLEQGVHLLVIDTHPPNAFNPRGVHGAIWAEIDPTTTFEPPDDRILTLASYNAGPPIEAFVEPFTVGTALPAMPLFLDPQWYVNLPLQSTYDAAWEVVPERWRRQLAR